MKQTTDIPKDYRTIQKDAIANCTSGRKGYERVDEARLAKIGYQTDGVNECACDSYRLHWEGDKPASDFLAKLVITEGERTELTLDAALLDWLKVAAKIAGERGAVKMSADGLSVSTSDTWRNINSKIYCCRGDDGPSGARFTRPVHTAEGQTIGLNPEFLLQAFEYLMRGNRKKPVTITVQTIGPLRPIALHNCTRHCLIMPIRID